MEAAAEDPVGRGEEGDREVEGPVEGAGPTGRREVQRGGAGLPFDHGRGQAGAGGGRAGGVGVDGGAGSESGEVGAGGTSLFLPTPDFMATAGTA